VNRRWLGARRANDLQECPVPLHNRVYRWSGSRWQSTLIHRRGIAGERVTAGGNENAKADGQKESALHSHTSVDWGGRIMPGGIGAHRGAITEETASVALIFPPKYEGATEGRLRSRF
jgi:hypothetical protein